jgi:hypothetical protein
VERRLGHRPRGLGRLPKPDLDLAAIGLAFIRAHSHTAVAWYWMGLAESTIASQVAGTHAETKPARWALGTDPCLLDHCPFIA